VHQVGFSLHDYLEGHGQWNVKKENKAFGLSLKCVLKETQREGEDLINLA
jgi:hypothetical protein